MNQRRLWAPMPVDLAVALVCAVLGLWWVGSRMAGGSLAAPLWPGEQAPVWLAATTQLTGSAGLIWRRRWPLPVLLLASATQIILPNPATTVAVYTVGRRVSSPRVSMGGLIVGAGLTAPSWFSAIHTPFRISGSLFALLLAFSWVVGRGERSNIEAAGLRQAARVAELGRAAQEAREAERSALAREMHDVVAHRISLIVLRANLLEAKSADASVQDAAQSIRDTGRAALDEMRQVLGLLSRHEVKGDAESTSAEMESSQAATPPQQSLRELDDLVREARSVGQSVDMVLAVQPRPVPDIAERTVYRIVREALTNAVRHAPGAATHVLVDNDDGPSGQGDGGGGEVLHVRVVNEPSQAPDTGITTGGNGLRGLRERVILVGGSITAGPTTDGGFAVDATLPRGKSL